MNQHEINHQAWNNASNWTLSSIYHSKEDSRSIVEKRRGYGWTLNFARPLPRLFAVLAASVILVGCGLSILPYVL